MASLFELLLVVVLMWVTCRIVGQVLNAHGGSSRTANRLASATFLGVLGVSFYTVPPEDAETAVAVIVRALLIGGGALTIVNLLLPPLVFVLRGAVRAIRSSYSACGAPYRRYRAHRRAKADRVLAELAAKQAVVDADTRAQRSRAEAERRAAEQRRREDARASCHLLYHLFAPEVGGRFPRSDLDAYVSRYLGDDHAPDYVEQRAAQLNEVLKQHLQHVKPMTRFKTVEQLATWFQDQVAQLDGIADERMRRNCLALLKTRYAEMTTQFLNEVHS